MFRLGRSSSHASKSHQLPADRIHRDVRHKHIDCFFVCTHACTSPTVYAHMCARAPRCKHSHKQPHERQYKLGGQTERERQIQGLGKEKLREEERDRERERDRGERVRDRE